MKSGTIKHLDSDGQWNGMKKTKVTFKDGRAYTFFSKGEFSASIGDTVKYTVTNEDMYNAKLIRQDLKNKKKLDESFVLDEFREDTKTRKEVKGEWLRQDLYLNVRTSCIIAASNFHAQRVSDVETLINDAEKMYNWINK
ncbi:hypothetical protein N9015_01155 [Akkermansiaceae bacterium]|nr:hypothetical protein [Akkermansiaceae bacterium]